MDMDKEGWAVRGAAAGVGSAGNSINNLRHVCVCVCEHEFCVCLSLFVAGECLRITCTY